MSRRSVSATPSPPSEPAQFHTTGDYGLGDDLSLWVVTQSGPRRQWAPVSQTDVNFLNGLSERYEAGERLTSQQLSEVDRYIEALASFKRRSERKAPSRAGRHFDQPAYRQSGARQNVGPTRFASEATAGGAPRPSLSAFGAPAPSPAAAPLPTQKSAFQRRGIYPPVTTSSAGLAQPHRHAGQPTGSAYARGSLLPSRVPAKKSAYPAPLIGAARGATPIRGVTAKSAAGSQRNTGYAPASQARNPIRLPTQAPAQHRTPSNLLQSQQRQGPLYPPHRRAPAGPTQGRPQVATGRGRIY